MKKLSLIKKVGILGLATLIQQTSYSGWLSNIGQRIVNGAVNTVQNNISRKVNKTVDDALDGKLGNTTENKTKSNDKHNQSAAYVDKKVVESKGNEVKNVQKDSTVKSTITEGATNFIKSHTNRRGKAIPYTNKYEKIDLGFDFEFVGEFIYEKKLHPGQESAFVNEFLDPGLYFIHAMCLPFDQKIYFSGVDEEKGLVLGYGINVLKTIKDNSEIYITGKDNGIMYLVEVLPNEQGELRAALINSENLKGQGQVKIYKVPEAPKFLK